MTDLLICLAFAPLFILLWAVMRITHPFKRQQGFYWDPESKTHKPF